MLLFKAVMGLIVTIAGCIVVVQDLNSEYPENVIIGTTIAILGSVMTIWNYLDWRKQTKEQ